MASKHRIAVIAGDGIGKEVVPAGIEVVEAAGRRFGVEFEWTEFDWSCERYSKTGEMMPKDGLDQLKPFESIFLGAVGWPGVPDHISLWGLLIPIRRGFDQYANVRPVRLFEGVSCPLAGRKPGEIDFYVVRENTEGEYSSIGGRMLEGTDREFVVQEAVFTRIGTDRIMKYAFEMATKRKRKHVTSATKSNGIIFSMPYWDERFAAMAKNYPWRDHRRLPYRHPDGALRAQPALVRRRRRQQSVRRYPLRPRAGGGRLDRHRTQRQHQPGAPVSLDVRAGARLGPRHRRQGHLQSHRPGLSGAMMLDHLGHKDAADAIVRAIETVLAGGGPKTPDLGGNGGTKDLTRALVEAVKAA